jgi:hypothetical protein
MVTVTVATTITIIRSDASATTARGKSPGGVAQDAMTPQYLVIITGVAQALARQERPERADSGI